MGFGTPNPYHKGNLMALWMKLFHVLTAFWFIGGFMGRAITMWQASRTDDVKMAAMLAKLAGIFDKWMVIPGSLVVLGFGLITAWMQGWPSLGVLQGSSVNWLFVSLVLYLATAPIIAFIFIPSGKIFGKALDDALTQGYVTAELKAAFQNRAVALGHLYE
jgi:uncharacterized membrane protein